MCHWHVNLLVLFDSGWLAELGCGGPVQVEAYHPDSRPIQNLPFLAFVLGFRRRHLMQIEICRNAVVFIDQSK
jgi:hypothetical protein